MGGAFRERHERGAGCDGRLQCFELVNSWRLGFALHDRQELTSACRQSDLSAPRAQVLRARKLANRKVGPLRGSNSRGAASPLGDRVRSAGEGCIRGIYQSIPVHPKWCTGPRAHVDARRSARPPGFEDGYEDRRALEPDNSRGDDARVDACASGCLTSLSFSVSCLRKAGTHSHRVYDGDVHSPHALSGI